MAIAEWTGTVGLPHILNTLVQVLKEEEATMTGKKVTQQQLEDLLPHLCLSLPSCSITCADLLHSMPDGSSVWSQLEEALTKKEFLHHDITSVLYLRHQAALEREVMRVLELYVGVECQDWWWEDERLDISHFKPHGKLLRANPTPGEDVSRATGEEDVHKVNHWADSPLMQVSAHNNELFTRCLHLLGNVLLKTRFSFCATIACRDFLAQVSEEMEEELYHSFPSVLSHLAYLLTLPLPALKDQSDLRVCSMLSVVKHGLKEEVVGGGEAAREKVCVMLCFFPFWLPLLRKCGFLKNYLVDGTCDIFSGYG